MSPGTTYFNYKALGNARTNASRSTIWRRCILTAVVLKLSLDLKSSVPYASSVEACTITYVFVRDSGLITLWNLPKPFHTRFSVPGS